MTGFDMFAQGAWDDRALVNGWNAQVNEYKVSRPDTRLVKGNVQ